MAQFLLLFDPDTLDEAPSVLLEDAAFFAAEHEAPPVHGGKSLAVVEVSEADLHLAVVAFPQPPPTAAVPPLSTEMEAIRGEVGLLIEAGVVNEVVANFF